MTEATETERTPHLERETKLAPHAGFELSDVDGVVPGSTTKPLPALDLSATYFDTHALTLARAGITIRHRTGDGPPTWTLKLPAGDSSGAIVRRELDIEGEHDHRPREMATAVAAHLRGRRLTPVAEIHTIRSRVVIEDESGLALVEVACDLVTATRGRQTLGSWEEIEVEALGAPEGVAAHRKVVRALRKAGCKKVGAVPKLVRALGDDASAPPEVCVPALTSHPTVVDAVEHALARSVVQLLAHDPAVRVGADPEDLHQFRVATRRLRSDLRTFRKFFDAETATRVRGELRWLTDQTNTLRDLDVLRAWLQLQEEYIPFFDQPAIEVLISRCEREAADQRAALLRALGSSRYDDLLHDLIDLRETPPELRHKSERRARQHLLRQVHRRRDALEAQMEAMGSRSDPGDLHQARIAAKRYRAAVEAIVPLSGRAMSRLAHALAELQDVLGAVHDASVIEDWLREAGGTPEAFVAGELAAMAHASGSSHAARWPDAWARVQRRQRAA